MCVGGEVKLISMFYHKNNESTFKISAISHKKLDQEDILPVNIRLRSYLYSELKWNIMEHLDEAD